MSNLTIKSGASLLPVDGTGGLYVDLYELTMAQGLFLTGRHNEPAIFDYFFRNNPFDGHYAVFCGTETFLDCLELFRFGDDAIEYLRQLGFDGKFLDWLRSYEPDFTGISAPAEGTLVFNGEPIVQVCGPFASCLLIETLLLNCLNFETLIATKASRMRDVAGDKKLLIDFGMRRAHGFAARTVSKAAIIGGFDSSSNTLSGFENGHPVNGTMGHAWVQSFDSEHDAFITFSRIIREQSILLIDTYDTLGSGLPNVIKAAQTLEKEGIRIKGIRLDSGDLLKLSKETRKQLDQAGLGHILISASNELDEHSIRDLIAQNAPIDAFGIGTRLVTGMDNPALGGVYKLSSINGRPVMKFSDNPEKQTLPGDKNVFRKLDGGRFEHDLICLSGENPGQGYVALREEIFRNGQRIGSKESLQEKAERLKSGKTKLSSLAFRSGKHEADQYPVKVSKKLQELTETLSNKL